ncbi:MAG: hypothetical protein LBS83_01095 [Holosporales bacterium]|nr:hypothetical protein [Holosporales bacterium]
MTRYQNDEDLNFEEISQGILGILGTEEMYSVLYDVMEKIKSKRENEEAAKREREREEAAEKALQGMRKAKRKKKVG